MGPLGEKSTARALLARLDFAAIVRPAREPSAARGKRIMSAEPPAPPAPTAIGDAKRLLRLARTGALATLERDGAGPLTTLVGVASDWDGSPLFLMSELSRHTRNLATDPRASLLVTSGPGRGDPLNRPRLTVGGPVTVHANPNSRDRYLRRYPKAKLYASFGDFSLRRMNIEAIHFNGGFGRADAIAKEDLLTPAGDIGALIAAEDGLLKEVGALGEAAIARLVGGAPRGRRVWRAVGLDAEGFDLASGGATARVDFSHAAYDPASWRRRLGEILAAPASG
jgi:heme iron utilization protein